MRLRKRLAVQRKSCESGQQFAKPNSRASRGKEEREKGEQVREEAKRGTRLKVELRQESQNCHHSRLAEPLKRLRLNLNLNIGGQSLFCGLAGRARSPPASAASARGEPPPPPIGAPIQRRAIAAADDDIVYKTTFLRQLDEVRPPPEAHAQLEAGRPELYRRQSEKCAALETRKLSRRKQRSVSFSESELELPRWPANSDREEEQQHDSQPQVELLAEAAKSKGATSVTCASGGGGASISARRANLATISGGASKNQSTRGRASKSSANSNEVDQEAEEEAEVEEEEEVEVEERRRRQIGRAAALSSSSLLLLSAASKYNPNKQGNANLGPNPSRCSKLALVGRQTRSMRLSGVSGGSRRGSGTSSTCSARLAGNANFAHEKPADKYNRLINLLNQLSIKSNQQQPQSSVIDNQHLAGAQTAAATAATSTTTTTSVDEPDLFQLEDHWSSFVQFEWRTSEEVEDETLAGVGSNLRVQQDAIWELIVTEAFYIKTLRMVIDLFLATLAHLKAHSLLVEIDAQQMASNIGEIYLANCSFWTHYLYPMLAQSRVQRTPLDPSTMRDGFVKIGNIFSPYYRFCLEQGACLRYVKEQSGSNELFKVFVVWCESQKDCERLRLMDLLAKPMQRLTRYSLLLKAILKRTDCRKQCQALEEMVSHMDRFVLTVDLELRRKDDLERLASASKRIVAYDIGIDVYNDEIDKLVKHYYCNFQLTAPLFNCPSNCYRQLLFDSSSQKLSAASNQQQLKFKDAQASGKLDIVLLLFTDHLFVCKPIGGWSSRSGSGAGSGQSASWMMLMAQQVNGGQSGCTGLRAQVPSDWHGQSPTRTSSAALDCAPNCSAGELSGQQLLLANEPACNGPASQEEQVGGAQLQRTSSKEANGSSNLRSTRMASLRSSTSSLVSHLRDSNLLARNSQLGHESNSGGAAAPAASKEANWAPNSPGGAPACGLRVIRSPYPIERLVMHELRDGQAVFCCQMNDSLTIANSFILYTPAISADHQQSSIGQLRQTSADSAGQAKSADSDHYSPESGRHLQGGPEPSTPARRLINLIKQAQARYQLAANYHSVHLETFTGPPVAASVGPAAGAGASAGSGERQADEDEQRPVAAADCCPNGQQPIFSRSRLSSWSSSFRHSARQSTKRTCSSKSAASCGSVSGADQLAANAHQPTCPSTPRAKQVLGPLQLEGSPESQLPWKPSSLSGRFASSENQLLLLAEQSAGSEPTSARNSINSQSKAMRFRNRNRNEGQLMRAIIEQHQLMLLNHSKYDQLFTYDYKHPTLDHEFLHTYLPVACNLVPGSASGEQRLRASSVRADPAAADLINTDGCRRRNSSVSPAACKRQQLAVARPKLDLVSPSESQKSVFGESNASCLANANLSQILETNQRPALLLAAESQLGHGNTGERQLLSPHRYSGYLNDYKRLLQDKRANLADPRLNRSQPMNFRPNFRRSAKAMGLADQLQSQGEIGAAGSQHQSSDSDTILEAAKWRHKLARSNHASSAQSSSSSTRSSSPLKGQNSPSSKLSPQIGGPACSQLGHAFRESTRVRRHLSSFRRQNVVVLSSICADQTHPLQRISCPSNAQRGLDTNAKSLSSDSEILQLGPRNARPPSETCLSLASSTLSCNDATLTPAEDADSYEDRRRRLQAHNRRAQASTCDSLDLTLLAAPVSKVDPAERDSSSVRATSFELGSLQANRKLKGTARAAEHEPAAPTDQPAHPRSASLETRAHISFTLTLPTANGADETSLVCGPPDPVSSPERPISHLLGRPVYLNIPQRKRRSTGDRVSQSLDSANCGLANGGSLRRAKREKHSLDENETSQLRCATSRRRSNCFPPDRHSKLEAPIRPRSGSIQPGLPAFNVTSLARPRSKELATLGGAVAENPSGGAGETNRLEDNWRTRGQSGRQLSQSKTGCSGRDSPVFSDTQFDGRAEGIEDENDEADEDNDEDDEDADADDDADDDDDDDDYDSEFGFVQPTMQCQCLGAEPSPIYWRQQHDQFHLSRRLAGGGQLDEGQPAAAAEAVLNDIGCLGSLMRPQVSQLKDEPAAGKAYLGFHEKLELHERRKARTRHLDVRQAASSRGDKSANGSVGSAQPIPMKAAASASAAASRSLRALNSLTRSVTGDLLESLFRAASLRNVPSAAADSCKADA